VGSHSLYHHHVPISPEIVGFVDPSTDTDFTANVPIPRLDGRAEAELGMPIYRGCPRYTVESAFQPDPDGLQRVRDFVCAHGPELFTRAEWARELAHLVPRTGTRETASEADAAVVADMRESLERLTRECPNPAQRQLCYPWYARTTRTDALAKQAGVTLLLGGIKVRHRSAAGNSPPILQRLPPDLLWRLPGSNRRALSALVWRRGRAIAAGLLRH
jgi:hypothetical protein